MERQVLESAEYLKQQGVDVAINCHEEDFERVIETTCGCCILICWCGCFRKSYRPLNRGGRLVGYDKHLLQMHIRYCLKPKKAWSLR